MVAGTHYNFDLARIGYAQAALRTERAEAAVCKSWAAVVSSAGIHLPTDILLSPV
jgi:hypothetical protein